MVNSQKLIAVLSVLVITVFTASTNWAQSKLNSVDKADSLYIQYDQLYGPDQVIVNGRNLENAYIYDIGSPFYASDEYVAGYIIFRNTRFDVSLKYNIYDQNLVVNYNFMDGAITYIPPNTFIEEFGVGAEVFKKQTLKDGSYLFYLDIYDGEIRCLKTWSKKRYDSNHNQNFKAYKYSDSQPKMYIEMNGTLSLYKSKGKFLKLFPKASRKEIADYMKINGVNIKTSENIVLQDFFEYCDSLVVSGDFSQITK